MTQRPAAGFDADTLAEAASVGVAEVDGLEAEVDGFGDAVVLLLGVGLVLGAPVGIALGALLWAFLDKSALALDNVGVPREIVLIMQGSIVLSVVVAYEIVRRYELAAEQRRVAAQLRARGADPAPSLPAYDVTVADATEALVLVVRLEEGMALRWRDLVGGTDDADLRRLALSGLQETAVRAATWRGLAGAGPVTVALPGTA